MSEETETETELELESPVIVRRRKMPPPTPKKLWQIVPLWARIIAVLFFATAVGSLWSITHPEKPIDHEKEYRAKYVLTPMHEIEQDLGKPSYMVWDGSGFIHSMEYDRGSYIVTFKGYGGRCDRIDFRYR